MSGLTSEVIEAKKAALALAALPTATKNRALEAMAAALRSHKQEILEANAADVAESEGKIPPEMMRRLRTDAGKVDEMAESVEAVASLPDPVGETMDTVELDEGLTLYQIRWPIGLVGVIFEARPEVVPQIMSLCLKSGNAVVFKGGSEAKRSNRVLFDILREAAASEGVPKEAFVLMESREDVSEILKLDGVIDLLVPRGSYSFVKYIQENTKIPVLGHSSGVCHVYIDGAADPKKAIEVTVDSKTQYPAVCNAAEQLLVDKKIARYILPRVADALIAKGVEIRASADCMPHLLGLPVKEATEEDKSAEYDDRIMSVRTVDGLEDAIAQINKYGSHHTDCIITEDKQAAERFIRGVDSADVMVNASTRFADGYRFGKGAEIGISTGKIHARGPMGMEGLCIYKYVVIGNGQKVADYSGPGAKKYIHKHIQKKLDLGE
ncbi:MAG: glutamate-5-semialdehyde dehydrogenase [Methanomethylophilus sp.]|jgi:glutamate-5-semialdehyde dehydrogenase